MDGENANENRFSRRKLGMEPEFLHLTSPGRRGECSKNIRAQLPTDTNPGVNEFGNVFDDGHGSVASGHSRKSRASFFSTATSQRSMVRRQKLQAEINSMERMSKLQEELEKKRLEVEQRKFQRQAEIERRRLEIEELELEDNDLEPEDGQNSFVILPENPAEVDVRPKVNAWLENQPTADRHIGENSVNLQEQLVMTNKRLERILSRQSVSKELPFFSGNPEEWPMFLRQYQRTTELCGLTDDENMLRLNKALKGKAREAVQPVLGIPENIDAVMQTLELMFGRPDQVIERMVQKVRSTPAPKEGRPESLISYGNQIANLVANMQMLRKQGHLANPTLLNELVTKLPYQLRYQWCCWSMCLKRDVTLVDLSEWMRTVAMTVSLMPTEITPEIINNQNINKKSVLTAVSWNEKSTCLCCDKAGHKLVDCRKFGAMNAQEKWKLVKVKLICYCCLSEGHRSNDCKVKSSCDVDGCSRNHHKLLHKSKNEEAKVGSVADGGVKKSDDNAAPEVCGLVGLNGALTDVLLRVIPVKITGPAVELSTFALLDEGSTVTMVDELFAKKLNLTGPVDPLCMRWTNEMVKDESKSRRVSLKISGVKEPAKEFTLFNVRTVQELSLPAQSVDMESMRINWPYLNDIPFDSITAAQPEILIGSDNIILTTSRKVRQGHWNDPVATKTWLGWVVHGNVVKSNRIDNCYSFHACEDSRVETQLNKLVQDSFSIEAFGVRVLDTPLRSLEDERSIFIMESKTKKVGDRYETGLLWKQENIRLPESKHNALRRLCCMERKMDRDSRFAEEYCNKIDDYLAKGYCRKLTLKEASQVGPRTNYIPHFAVYNPNKPGKLRLVMDAAAKSHGVSLNDCLLKGPDLLNPLPAVLMRFREHRIGMIGDIKEMFHQVKIVREDQDSQRFLWRGKDRKRDPDVLIMTSMIFGAACSPSSAQYVKNLMAAENKQEFPEIADAVVKDMYVDDLLHGGEDENAVVKKINDFIRLFKLGGFHICNWASSSKAVMVKIPPEFRSKGLVELKTDVHTTERVLGLRWSGEDDAFIFELVFHKVHADILNGIKIPTKREVLRLVMSIFDPLGIVAHFLVKAKILFQKIWLSKIEWDDSLTMAQHEVWKKWLEELHRIVDVRMPRCYSPRLRLADSIQLHTFVDASLEAIASVSFLRVKTGENVELAFVLGRTRVAPTKPMSVPRLELQAAVMGARMSSTVITELNIKIDKSYFWSDFRTVLCWIRSEKRNFKQFVGHRIGEILETTQVNEWHWVPTAENPADDGTRSSTVNDLSSTCRWMKGPEFLKCDPSKWPEEPSMKDVILPVEETKREVVCLVGIVSSFEFPNISRFSSWLKTIRTTAWCCRFIRNWVSVQKGLPLVNGELMTDELEFAETIWWREVQRTTFREEVLALKRNKSVDVSSRLHTLTPFLDKFDVIRVRGRTEMSANLDDGTKYPVILDPDHGFTKLLLQHYHEQGGHHGLETVLCNLRQKYWVLHIRSAVKKSFRNCQRCKILKVRPSPPLMGMLPEERLQAQVNPFTFSGVDYFGPIMVTEGRKQVKRYGVLFTCLATRAVHLEIAKNLSTDAAIMAIRRFVGRRGPVKRLLSDNGTNFRGANNELRQSVQELNSDEMRLQLATRGIDWRFIPPGSPHMGGSWERLIKSVKIALAAALNTDAPHEDTLHTLLVEVENLVNSRPLTHVSVDPDDPVSLTPNNFLKFRYMEGPLGKFTTDDLHMRKQWRRVQRYADIFWSRWVKEYLPTLTRRTKWFAEGRQIQIGDIVVIADKNGPRNTWPLGRIINVHPGKDGRVRVVEVKTKDGIYTRPATKICVLDVKKDDEEKKLPSSGGRNDVAS